MRHSVGNALRDICRARAALNKAKTATCDLADPAMRVIYQRVLYAH